jgi:hypothetical protein
MLSNNEINFPIENSSSYLSNAYKMFVFSIKWKLLGNIMKEDLKHFFDYINFDLENKKDMEKRCNNFAI